MFCLPGPIIFAPEKQKSESMELCIFFVDVCLVWSSFNLKQGDCGTRFLLAVTKTMFSLLSHLTMSWLGTLI